MQAGHDTVSVESRQVAIKKLKTRAKFITSSRALMITKGCWCMPEYIGSDPGTPPPISCTILTNALFEAKLTIIMECMGRNIAELDVREKGLKGKSKLRQSTRDALSDHMSIVHKIRCKQLTNNVDICLSNKCDRNIIKEISDPTELCLVDLAKVELDEGAQEVDWLPVDYLKR